MGAVQREGEEILDPDSLWYMDIRFLLLEEGFKSNTALDQRSQVNPMKRCSRSCQPHKGSCKPALHFVLYGPNQTAGFY